MNLLVNTLSLLLAKVLSVICITFAIAITSRFLDDQEQNRYIIYLATISVAQPLARLGLGRSLMSRLVCEDSQQRARTILKDLPTALLLSVIVGILVSPCIVVPSCVSAGSIESTDFASIAIEITGCCVCIILSALLQIVSDSLRGIAMGTAAAFFDAQRGGALSGISLTAMLLIASLFEGTTLFHVMILSALCYLACLVASVVWVRKDIVDLAESGLQATALKRLVGDGVYFCVIDFLASFLLFGDTWLAVLFLSPHDATQYYTLAQLASVVTFPVGMMSVAAIPIIVASYKSKDIHAAEHHARLIATISSVVTIPMMAAVAFGADFLLKHYYAKDTLDSPMSILCLLAAKAAYVISGPTSLCLAFLLKGWRSILMNSINVLLMCISLLLFASNQSFERFAIVLMCFAFVQNISESLLCWRVLRIKTFISFQLVFGWLILAYNALKRFARRNA